MGRWVLGGHARSHEDSRQSILSKLRPPPLTCTRSMQQHPQPPPPALAGPLFSSAPGTAEPWEGMELQRRGAGWAGPPQSGAGQYHSQTPGWRVGALGRGAPRVTQAGESWFCATHPQGQNEAHAAGLGGPRGRQPWDEEGRPEATVSWGRG